MSRCVLRSANNDSAILNDEADEATSAVVRREIFVLGVPRLQLPLQRLDGRKERQFLLRMVVVDDDRRNDLSHARRVELRRVTFPNAASARGTFLNARPGQCDWRSVA
jgi:hypothetical protein